MIKTIAKSIRFSDTNLLNKDLSHFDESVNDLIQKGWTLEKRYYLNIGDETCFVAELSGDETVLEKTNEEKELHLIPKYSECTRYCQYFDPYERICTCKNDYDIPSGCPYKKVW